ncbi:hypothetical protein LJC45_06195, partial [Alistipes sp. OttesenSCG-928-B03]|nr:hypothetical protein [Alistipes sp. OttesenSCG-928-B03]
MPGQLIARGQVTIHTQTDSYTITQSAGEYIFNAANDGSIQDQTTITSAVKVAQGGQQITDFTIGSISRPAGFAAIMVDNTLKTITYRINAGTKTLPDSGVITIPVNIAGVTYHLSFVWSKAKTGADGPSGVATLPEWLEEWDSGKTQINGNYVITPKLFAGVKNANGTITGTAIGKFSILTRNGQGQFQSEEVNGIYGFRDGYKTFSVDTTGSVELGRGEQSIKYDAATGKIEFGAAVALQWKGATYIDANGIFTGTLSADTINAIQINASQITAGTIHADLIDTAALKAELITASNIEALTLNVVRGTIGGWTIDADSIFRGDKNNLSGSYTSLSESITIGSNGIRGKAWRLESTGAGSVAGGNITWDINGNVTFGPSVSLYWINAAAEALESAKEDAAQKMDSAKELAQAMAYGRMLYRDPSFYNGTNGMAIYNSSTGNKLTISRIADSAAPNDSKYVVSLKNTGTTSPDCGGFSWKTQTQYRKVFITRIIARLPINRSLEFITNNVGTGGSHKWLTSNAGTGEWTEYIHKVSCGTANFSTTHYFYLSGAVGSSGSPVEWRIAYATV